MRAHSVHDGEAMGLAVRADAAVRLRLSPVERLLRVMRWVLGLAAAVVVLWVGAAFLAAPTAVAATMPVTASTQGAQKGGKEKPSGSSGSGGSNTKSSSGSKTSKQPAKKESTDKSSAKKEPTKKESTAKKEPTKKEPAEKKASAADKAPAKKASAEKAAATKKDTTEPAKKTVTKAESAKKTPVKESDEKKASAEKASVDKGAAKKDPAPKKAAAKDTTESAAKKTSMKAQPAKKTELAKKMSVKESNEKKAPAAKQPAGKAPVKKSSSAKETAAAKVTAAKAKTTVVKAATAGMKPLKSIAAETATAKAAVAKATSAAAKSATAAKAAAAKAKSAAAKAATAKTPSAKAAAAKAAVAAKATAVKAATAAKAAAVKAAAAETTAAEKTASTAEPTAAKTTATKTKSAAAKTAAAKTNAAAAEAASAAKATAATTASAAKAAAAKAKSAAVKAATAKTATAKAAATEAATAAKTAARKATAAKAMAAKTAAAAKAAAAKAAAAETTAAKAKSAAAKAGRDAAALRSGVASAADPRGPPRDGQKSEFGRWQSYDDSQEQTERVLNGEIKVDKSTAALAAEKKKVASGAVSKATYAKHEAAHKKLVKSVEADRAELSPERAELIDEVIDGQRGLAKTESALAAEQKKVKAGTVTVAVHKANVAKYEATKDKVYEATDELRAATGHEGPGEPSVRSGGTGAACGSSGAFFECDAVAKDRSTGEQRAERCMGLAGVSSGCSVAAGSGTNKAAGTCTIAGANQGCETSATTGRQSATASCTTGSGDCRNSSTTARDRAEGGCEGQQGCRSSSTGPTPADGSQGEGRSAASGSCVRECGITTFASARDASADCRTSNGSCDTTSSGTTRRTPTADKAATAVADSTGARTSEAATATGTAHCTATTGGCRTSSSSDLGNDVTDRWSRDPSWDANVTGAEYSAGGPRANAGVQCEQGATGCSGKASSSTGATVSTTEQAIAAATSATAAKPVTRTITHKTTSSAQCSVTAGGCDTSSGSDNSADDTGYGSGGSTGTARADTRIECDAAAGCSGTGATTTNATVSSGTGKRAAVRTTSGSSSCTATAGGCSADSTSNATARTDSGRDAWLDAAPAATGTTAIAVTLAASSNAGSEVDCASVACTGTAKSATTGSASGDIKGVRDSKGSASCAAHGAGGTCSADSDTSIEDRDPAASASGSQVSGPVSVSHATARVDCAGGTASCGGTAASSTSALDTAVSPQRRGSSSSADCTVSGGGCTGETSSAASSAPDYVQIDPATGQPVKGQPTSGPSSISSASASVDCSAGADCSGTAHTASAAWDGAVAGGKPRTSAGSATCEAGSGACRAETTSVALTTPGAVQALAGDSPARADRSGATQADAGPAAAGQVVNAARRPAGPSAASAAGAVLDCDGQAVCNGKVTSAATATDPSTSPDPRGSRGQGSCAGVSGGVCQAVTNSGASSGPDASSIAPLVRASSTANATVSRATTGDDGQDRAPADAPQDLPGQDQPATPPAPTAPGSSASSGAPTVPGASSWSSASATLDCSGSSGGCSGTARSSAAGSDGPSTTTGGVGARGPPAGESSSSGSCTTSESNCQASTNSTAGSGQVVADIITETQKDSAEQAAQQAEQAQQIAEQARDTAARDGATADEKKAATDAAKVATQARKAATDAAKLAATPVKNAPATLSESSSSAQCAAGDGSCAAATTGAAIVTAALGAEKDPAATSTSRSSGECRSSGSGCTVGSSAVATTERHTGMRSGAKSTSPMIPGRSGTTQASSTIDCPDSACTGTVTGDSAAAASPDGGSAAAIRAAQAGAKKTAKSNGAGTDPVSLSTSRGAASCTGQEGGCQAGITTGSSVAVHPGKGATAAGRFGTTSASVSADCRTASGACPTTTRSTSTGTDDPAVLAATQSSGKAGARARTTTAVATSTCSANGPCESATNGFASDNAAEVAASCAGTGCRTAIQGEARHGGNSATTRSACTAGADGVCQGTVRVGATPTGTEVSASCVGSTGADCSYSYRAHSSASGTGPGTRARASATGSGSGRFGGGQAATTAAAVAGPGSAQASASCTGSAGTRCSHSYSASAHASASSGSAYAAASASGSGRGGVGGGGVAVSAQAAAGLGTAQASASCSGAANCRHSYSARASAVAVYGGNRASASASGSGGGGEGGGGVAVSAQASAGPGYASAGASCGGAANCRFSYSASAAASASYEDGTHRSRAHAAARGSGGGRGPGGGGLSVYAQARAGKGYANAAAGCSGAVNCSASYSSHAEASKTVGGQHGEAWASCSGAGSGGTCGSSATVEVDSEQAVAQAACSGTGSCSTHYATRSASSASGEGISGDSGANCSGSRASGGYCATGSRAHYDPATGKLEVSSYCGTSGGGCSRYANVDIDASSPNGELTGTGPVRCSGGVGSCGLVGVAKYHPATTDGKGNPVPPMLVVGTGCDVQGTGSCTQNSRADARVVSPDGTITATATSVCSGTTGSCSTVVAGGLNPETGRIDAYADCASDGTGKCARSEAHLRGQVSGPGQATPDGPADGTVSGNGRADCVKTSGSCSVSGVFAYTPAEYQRDKNGTIVKDEDGNPLVIPAHVNVQTSCYPTGPHCGMEAHASGDVAQQSKDEKHTGTARADCAGTGGTCSLTASVASNAETGRVEAFTDCAGEGGGTCTRSETHTDAWVQSPDGKLTGHGRSDCVQSGGSCSSVSVAKYHAEFTKYPPKCTSPHGCFQAPPTTIPEHVVSGAGCDTNGDAAACSYSFSANGHREATGDDGRLTGNARGDCNDSGSTGSGSCTVAATVTVDAEKHKVDVVAWCEGSTGVSCSYTGQAAADHESGKNNAASGKSCGKAATGTCSLSVSAFTSGGDDERQGQAVASGFCADSNATCSGEFRTHVDSNRDTLSDCRSSGSGLCFGFATAKSAKSGGEVEDGGTLDLHSKAPGREESKECSSASSCGGEQWVEEMGGKYVVLDLETKKSVGGFFKNLGRDGGSVVVHAVPGLVDAVGTEVGSWVTANEWGDGLQGYAENRPFTGGVAQSAVNFYDRWLNDGGSWEKIGDDYYFTPVSTLLEDVGTVALVAAGAGVAVKLVSMGAKSAGAAAAGATATTGFRGALTSVGSAAGRAAPGLDAVAGATFRLANMTGNVALAPYKPYFWAGRAAAGVGSRVLAPASRAAFNGSAALSGRGAAALQNGRLAAGTRHTAGAGVLGRVGSALETSASGGRIMQRGGIFGRTIYTGSLLQRITAANPERVPGLLGTARAHHVLGLPFGRAVSLKELGTARQAASLQAWGTDIPTSPRRLTPLGYLRGHEAANAIRQKRVAKAYDVVLAGQARPGSPTQSAPPAPVPIGERVGDVPLRSEVVTGVKRPLIDRIDDVTVRNQAVDIATLAGHLDTSPAAVRDALGTATPGARGQGRYQLAQDPTTGAEVVVRAPAATPASGAGAGRVGPAASSRPGRGAESEVPSRPTVTAVRNADGTIGLRTPERAAGTVPDGPPVDYIVTAGPDGGWNVTTRPVSERPAWQYSAPPELPAATIVEIYRPKPASPLAEATLGRLTRRGGETRQAIGATVLLATHMLAPDVVGAVAPAPHQPAPAVTHAAKQSGFELGSFGMSAERSARGGTAPSPRPATTVGPVIAITPGLERDLANGRLGAMRTVPVTDRALSRLHAPRGVSAREWEAAGPVEKARFWHDLGESFAQQAKGAGRWSLAYELAAEAAANRAMFSEVAAVEAYLPVAPGTQRTVIDDLFRRLDTGAMTPPEVETLLQSGWSPSPAESREAVDLFAGRHQLAWTPAQRGEVADALHVVSKLGWRTPTERIMSHGGGSRFTPGAGDEQGAALQRGLTEAAGISRLADRTGLTVGQVVDVVRVVLQRVQAGAAVPRAGPDPVDGPRLDRLQPQELQVLASYGSGRSLERIAADLGLRPAEVKSSLDGAVEKLGRDGGRLPATEAGTRAEAAAQFASGARSGLWQVRNRLREIEAGLDPAERDALWNTADRIEEWLDRLSPPRRSQAYRELLAARIVSVRELATTSDSRLTEAGLSAATVAALRSVLPQDGLSAVAGVLAPARDGALGRPGMEALVRQALGVGLSEGTDRGRALAVLHGQLRTRHGPLAAAIGRGRPGPGPAARIGLAVPAVAAAGGGALGVLHGAPVPLVVGAAGLAMAAAAAAMTEFGPVRTRGPPALVTAYLVVGGSAVLGGGFATLGAGDSVAVIAGAITAVAGSAMFGTPRGARQGSAALGTRIAAAGPAGVLLALLAVAD
ncbi:MAG: mucin9, partial [Pseudonocardia sp.]